MHFLSTLALALSALGVQAGTVLHDHGYDFSRTRGGNYMIFTGRYNDRLTPVSRIAVDSEYKIASVSALYNHLEANDENKMSLSAIFSELCDLEQTLPKWMNFVVFDNVDVDTSKLASDYRSFHGLGALDPIEIDNKSDEWESFLGTPYYQSLQELLPEKAADVKKIIVESVKEDEYRVKNPRTITKMYFSFLAKSGPYDQPEKALAEVNGWSE
ncbi:hypothetical protein CFO_g5423 [Ceratocystis platani]|uniref:Uncharacterized protein n=1 Tax=Ceratocystis fimbriata f. sp. platani TaxID=88771 RepID=A0A0F8BJ24_CERFI|nr:hypothetical protein CFO_g5423 [Ceratocystis platani]